MWTRRSLGTFLDICSLWARQGPCNRHFSKVSPDDNDGRDGCGSAYPPFTSALLLYSVSRLKLPSTIYLHSAWMAHSGRVLSTHWPSKVPFALPELSPGWPSGKMLTSTLYLGGTWPARARGGAVYRGLGSLPAYPESVLLSLCHRALKEPLLWSGTGKTPRGHLEAPLPRD